MRLVAQNSKTDDHTTPETDKIRLFGGDTWTSSVPSSVATIRIQLIPMTVVIYCLRLGPRSLSPRVGLLGRRHLRCVLVVLRPQHLRAIGLAGSGRLGCDHTVSILVGAGLLVLGLVDPSHRRSMPPFFREFNKQLTDFY